MSIQCEKCDEWVAALPIHRCRSPRNISMPQTLEAYKKLADMDLEEAKAAAK